MNTGAFMFSVLLMYFCRQLIFVFPPPLLVHEKKLPRTEVCNENNLNI